MRTIQSGGECMKLHDNGDVERPAISHKPSGSWEITGAVVLNNFGQVLQQFTLQQILDNPATIPWKHKNGKQKTHLTDLDHGTHRVWMSPNHQVM